MNLRDLEYIIAVEKTGSFTKAARICNVSQPTLSGQIKKLEEELGVNLFERNKKKIFPTNEGLSIIERASTIMREIKAIEAIAETARNPLAGQLSIGAFPTLASYIFPETVIKLRADFPDLTIILVEEKTAELVQQLKSGTIDAALLALPVNEPSLEFEELFSDKFLLAVPKGHRLSEKKSISEEDLLNEKLMLLEEGHCLRGQALDYCQRLKMNEEDFRATSLETLRQMVKIGTGITLIPEIAVTDDPDLCYLEIQKTPPYRTIGIFWRKTSAKKEIIKSTIEVLTSILSKGSK